MTSHEPSADEPPALVVVGLARLQLESEGELTVPATGLSMGACLAPPCQVRIVPLAGLPRRGDVVAVQQGSEVVVHRVIGCPRGASSEFTTKGDACFHADPPRAAADIIGRAVEIVRGERRQVPWHWRPPFSRAVALLSGLEAALWPHFGYPLRVVHRAWRSRLHGRRPSRGGAPGEGQERP